MAGDAGADARLERDISKRLREIYESVIDHTVKFRVTAANGRF